jgi:hypothetical protein
MSVNGRIAFSGRFLLALATCWLISACGENPEPAASTPAAAAKPGSPLAQIPADMVAAVAAGKNADALGVHFALRSVPAAGQTLQVDIAIVPHEAFESLGARFEPQEGGIISGGRELEPKGSIKAEQVITHRIVLEPTREGVFMVTAAVETETLGVSTVRIFSIPVIVHSLSPTPNPPSSAPQG